MTDTQIVEPKYGEPPHRICDVCLDDGGCLNNEKHKDYDKNNEDFFGTDYIDCINYLEKKNNTEGQFMRGYLKGLQKENTVKYESDFCKWSKRFKSK